MITIKKGLDLPITGEPSREISEHRPAYVALVGYDYVGMKPTMNVKEGDIVAKGQPVLKTKNGSALSTLPLLLVRSSPLIAVSVVFLKVL